MRESDSAQWRGHIDYILRLLSCRQTLVRLIGVRILYAVLTAAVLGPLAAWIIRMLAKEGGNLMVSNFDLADFFLSFQGILFLLLTGTFAFTALFFEQSGVIFVAREYLGRGRLPTLMEVFKLQKNQFTRLLRLGMFYFLSGALAIVPTLLSAVVCFLVFLQDRDIYYYVNVKPKEFWMSLGITAIPALFSLAALLWIYLRWFLALPILMFEEKGVREAVRESRIRSRDRGINFGREMLIVTGLVVIAWLIVSLLLKAGDHLFFEFFGDRVEIVVLGAGLMVLVHFLASLVITFVEFSSQGILVACHFLASSTSERLSTEVNNEKITDELSDHKKTRPVTWVVAGLVLLSSIIIALNMLRNISLDQDVKVTAHRGSSLATPENTMSAVRLAMEEGADYAEIDIQITADGELVMFHDNELMRVCGIDMRVADLTREKRLTLDVGAWFSDEFKGEPMVTLEEVMDLVRGKMKLNIELKYGPDRDGLSRGVADLIAAENFADECVVSSLDYEGLKDFQQLAPGVKTGLIVTSAVGDVTRAQADFLSLNASQVNRAVIASAESRGRQVHVWTVNDPASMHSMIDMGVDNILTDSPAVLVDLIRQRAELSSVELLVLQLRSRFAN